ncbi:MAG: GspH/FimT family pseudopilin [Pseudomonadota bacterium]
MSWRPGQKAFTILELLVVLTILAIMAFLTVPSFLTFINETHVTSYAEDLLYNLQYARSEAIKRNSNVYVSFTTGSTWCYGINVGSSCTCSTSGSCGLGAFLAPSGIATMSTTGLSSGSLIFEGTRGAATNGASKIIFTIVGGTMAIGVTLTGLGNMQMCSSTISGYSACP